jgi:hypothetical protein
MSLISAMPHSPWVEPAGGGVERGWKAEIRRHWAENVYVDLPWPHVIVILMTVALTVNYCEKSVWFLNVFSAFSVLHKSYRQVLTPVNNLQLLLRLPILDKFRLVTFHLQATQRNYNNWFPPVQEKREFPWPWFIAHRHQQHLLLWACHKPLMPSTDILTLLSESTSLSQNVNYASIHVALALLES